MIRIQQYIYTKEDRRTAVNEHDPSGRFLLASPGTEITEADAAFFGIGPDGFILKKELKQAIKPETKELKGVEDKELTEQPAKRGRPAKDKGDING